MSAELHPDLVRSINEIPEPPSLLSLIYQDQEGVRVLTHRVFYYYDSLPADAYEEALMYPDGTFSTITKPTYLYPKDEYKYGRVKIPPFKYLKTIPFLRKSVSRQTLRSVRVALNV